jgi:hypothetical protein
VVGKQYAKALGALEVCDAVAQTAKHHTRHQSSNPITAAAVELFGDQTGVHTDIKWTSADSAKQGQRDALELADLCIDAWQTFFRLNKLNPDA